MLVKIKIVCVWYVHVQTCQGVKATYLDMLGTYSVRGISHCVKATYLDTLGTYSVRGIPGYTLCKGYICWPYPVAGIPRNPRYTSCKGNLLEMFDSIETCKKLNNIW